MWNFFKPTKYSSHQLERDLVISSFNMNFNWFFLSQNNLLLIQKDIKLFSQNTKLLGKIFASVSRETLWYKPCDAWIYMKNLSIIVEPIFKEILNWNMTDSFKTIISEFKLVF